GLPRGRGGPGARGRTLPGGGDAAADHARHFAPAGLRPRRTRGGEGDVRPAAPPPVDLPRHPMTAAMVSDLIPTPPTVGTILLVVSLAGVVLAGVLTAAEEAIGWLTRSAAADYAAQHARGAHVQRAAEYPARARRAASFAR